MNMELISGIPTWVYILEGYNEKQQLVGLTNKDYNYDYTIAV